MKKNLLPMFVVIVSLLLVPMLQAGVLINEIFYNSPGDLDDLQYVELFNFSNEEEDLSGWSFSKGIKFNFAEGARLAPGAYFVLCKNSALFEQIYEATPDGKFNGSLSRGGEKITLRDSEGKEVESVEYTDAEPWPMSADGYSASLERITPSTQANDSANWAPSILSDDYGTKPSGTPGKKNSTHADAFPPLIDSVRFSTRTHRPGEKIDVQAQVQSDVDRVELLYRVVQPGNDGPETAIVMSAENGQDYSASIPGQEASRIVRFRVRAIGRNKAIRIFPHANEVRPALSIYISEPLEISQLPIVQYFATSEKVFQQTEAYRNNRGRSFGRSGFGFGPPPEPSPEEKQRQQARNRVEGASLQKVWSDLTLKADVPSATIMQLTASFGKAEQSLSTLREQADTTRDIQLFVDELPAALDSIRQKLVTACRTVLSEEELKILVAHFEQNEISNEPRRLNDPSSIVAVFFNVEDSWYRSALRADLSKDQVSRLFALHQKAFSVRNQMTQKISSGEPGLDFRATLDRARSERETLDNQIASVLGINQSRPPGLVRSRGARPQPFGGGPGGGGFLGPGNSPALLPQGQTALIYQAPGSNEPVLFDFLNITERKSGHKIRFHKDRPLNGIRTMNVLYEPDQATIMNESLSYQLYQLAGNAGVDSGFVRVVVNGQPVGYHVWFEQPNANFFRRHEIDDGGNLYKVIWQGSNRPSPHTPEDKMPKRMDIVSRYEKKFHPHDGYDDLEKLITALEESTGDEEAMWNVIQTHFEVDQVINYYAVNMLISHWDGFFNNYFLYHDLKGSGKWSLYPWDQDSTWSQRGGSPEELHKIPLNYGAEGARPPGVGPSTNDGGRRRGGFGGFGLQRGFGYWRDGDSISRPLLANPTFRGKFLSRLKELTSNVFTVEEFGPRIELLKKQLEPEVRLRAEVSNQNPDTAVVVFHQTISSLQEHLNKRRAFVVQELQPQQ